MQTQDITPAYRIWEASAATETVELPMIITWIKADRVRPGTWVYLEHDSRWSKAAEVAELKMFFKPKPAPAGSPPTEPGTSIKTGVLRRIKILADLSEDQLAVFVHYMQVLNFKQFSQVVRKDEHGDSMFMILEGELRVRVMIDRRESILATLNAGEFFGEIAVLDHGPRSADVIANKDSVLLKISSEAFEKLQQDAPQVALSFLFGLSKSVVGRIRALNKRYEDSIHFQRVASAIT